MNGCKIVISAVILFAVFAEVYAANPAPDINAKLAQLDTNTANLDDVIRVFGEPVKYVWGNQTYTKDNLPDGYIAQYPNGFSVAISAGSIVELRFDSPAAGYVFRDKIRVGSPLDEVLDVVGKPTETVEGTPNKWEDGVLYKNIDGRKGYCYYARSDKNVRFFFGNYQVAGLYITTQNQILSSDNSFQKIRPVDFVEEFNDVQWKDLSKLDLSGKKKLVETLTFNKKTVWPAEILKGNDIDKILTNAMNPGLGIRELHRQGITGKGVNVAIIDQAMYLDHPEFAGKIAKYYDIAQGNQSSMHGPAVTSLLVGANCGTAPRAKVYYAAAPSGLGDSEYYAKALDRIIEQNRQLPPSEKIRVVSVSAAPSGAGSPFTKNTEMWDQACARAEAAGILVLDCTHRHGFIGPCWYDSSDPENVTRCDPGFPGQISKTYHSRILVPASPRTTAEEYDKGDFGYQYCGRGGLSWSIPYCAGVLALGWQIRPELGPEQMKQLLFDSAYTTASGEKIINPKVFIKRVKAAKLAK